MVTKKIRLEVGNFGSFSVEPDSLLYDLLDSHSIIQKILSAAPVPDICRGFMDMSKSPPAFTLCGSNPDSSENYVRHDIRLSADKKTVWEELSRRHKNLSKRSFVLLLESPHKDEYKLDMQPLVPANGDSGDQIIHKHNGLMHIQQLGMYLKEQFTVLDRCYPVFLCNPIQYQTSLHHLLGVPIIPSIRDNVWTQIWEKIPEIREYFVKRLQAYKPILIINGCTKSKTAGKPLSEKVWKEIEANFKSNRTVYYCSTAHPCCWNRQKHRKYCFAKKKMKVYKSDIGWNDYPCKESSPK